MKAKKFLLTALAASIAQMVLMTLSYFATKETWVKYSSLPVWRDMPMPSWFIQLYLGTFALCAIYVFFYSLFYESLPGEGMLKGVLYGLILWTLVSLNYNFISWMFYAVPNEIIANRLVGDLIALPITGGVIAAAFEKW